jgi:saccharopine dehydrogenase-like NADP-dependent oxidoreductase
MKKILVLGAGLVAKPLVDYLLQNKYFVSLADVDFEKARSMLAGHSKGQAFCLDVRDESGLGKIISENDLVVSLLPFVFHPLVAQKCIQFKKHLVTTSYVKEAMMVLDSAAREAGIILLNEIGLDPGLDHMSAKKIIDDVHARGGTIREFYSFCGALPAPELIDNPFGYKFSWSPKGVLIASRYGARYLKNNKIKEVQGEALFNDLISARIEGIGQLSIYPNRDSIPYIDTYAIPEAETLMRGTIRFEHWCSIMHHIKSLGLLNDDTFPDRIKSSKDLLKYVSGYSGSASLPDFLAQRLHIPLDGELIKAFEYLGFFTDKPLPKPGESIFENFAEIMISQMLMKKGERDLVLMKHRIRIREADGSEVLLKSVLVEYGVPDKYTAVAKTVALPAAIAVRKILSGEIQEKGVQIPVIPQIYLSVLEELKQHGIILMEEYEGLDQQ